MMSVCHKCKGHGYILDQELNGNIPFWKAAYKSCPECKKKKEKGDINEQQAISSINRINKD